MIEDYHKRMVRDPNNPQPTTMGQTHDKGNDLETRLGIGNQNPMGDTTKTACLIQGCWTPTKPDSDFCRQHHQQLTDETPIRHPPEPLHVRWQALLRRRINP